MSQRPANQDPSAHVRDEAELRLRRRQAAEKKKKQQAKKERQRIFRGRLIMFLIVFLLIGIAALTVFLLFFHSSPDAPPTKGTVTYLYGGSEKRKADASQFITSKGVYLCFNDLAEYVGMAETGTSSHMKFVLTSGILPDSSEGSGKEEYISFSINGTDVDINGQVIQLKIPNLISDENVWVSSDFVETYMNGLSIKYNQRKSTVSVAKIIDEELSDKANTVYLPVSFKLKASVTSDQLEEDPLFGEVIFNSEGDYELNFTADLSAYEKYMNPDEAVRDSFLALVNKDNTLQASDLPTDLTDVKYSSTVKGTQTLRNYAAMALEALFEEMHALGYYDMVVYQGYVSFTAQKNQFELYKANEMAANPYLTAEDADDIVRTYATLPGMDEHQTGLAVDMDTMGCYTTDFQYTAEYQWLTENAWKFGFILRYPSDKESVTSMSFEPWHYRYVGRYHALKIHESGLTLEEYLKEIKK